MESTKQPLAPPAVLDEEPTSDALPPAEGPALAHTVAVLAPDGPHALVSRIWLHVLTGPDAGAMIANKSDRTVIGTHDSADIVLHDPTVSRFHCEVVLDAGRLVLGDLGSRNGTFVDGVSVLKGHLRNGSTVTVGRTQIRVEIGAETVKLPLSQEERFGAMVGRSTASRRAFEMLERAAQSDATVLLVGETGTGKEVAAESIHDASARKEKPFIVVDCAAIPSELLESELFGHEKGSFTGAVTSREGAFQAADGGTIFLDEIGELSTDLQPKLLRVLERRHIKKVGGTRFVPVDVRVVAATNRNLRTEVNNRRFRSELYYRLAVLEVRLPPLRERIEDLPLLINHILQKLGAAGEEAAFVRTSQFLADIARHSWPGNVRELRNYLERCLAMREQTPFDAEQAERSVEGAPIVDPSRPLKEAREAWVQSFERRYLEAMLALHEGNIRAAARAAEVDRAYFYRLLWRHGLK